MALSFRHVPFCLALVGVLSLPAATWGATTATVTGSKEAPRIILENSFTKLTIEPARGGHCTGFLYKPTGKLLLRPEVGKLQGVRVWNYTDGDLYMQWQKRAWEYEIDRRKDGVTVVLRAAGEINFTRSTTFEKRLTLRNNEAMVRVTTTFHVGEELMEGFPIGLWFANQAGVVGEETQYSFPLDTGIMTLDLSTAAGQEWFYQPVRGWITALGKSGTGLSLNMEYQRLMCFYMWPGKQPTLEWAFRTAEIGNGESLSTEQLMVPFAGLNAVHGSGAGIVAGIDGPEAPSLEKAAAGLAFTAKVASGTAHDGRLELSVQKLPDGTPQPIVARDLKLRPGACESVPFALTLKAPGTYLVTGRISADGKELMDFVRPLKVGQTEVPVRVAAKQERLGRKSQRFEDRVPLSGGGPKDLELSTAVESPHTKWARPRAGGKLNVLVLTSCLTGREAIELGQRLDMNLMWVTAGTQPELSSLSWVFGKGKKFTYTTQRMNENIQQALTQPCDAIIIGGLRGDLFTEETVALFRRKVEEGVGLVYIAPNRGRDDIYDLLPVGRETALRSRSGQWRRSIDHPITTGIPFDVLPQTRHTVYPVEGEVLAHIGRSPLLVVQEGPGKGRVAVLSYETSWQRSGSHSSGITPWLEGDSCRFAYWEYYFSLFAKALVWTADKPSPVALADVNTDSPDAVAFALENSGPAIEAKVELTVSDDLGRTLSTGTQSLTVAEGAASFSVPLADDLPGGTLLVDAIVRDSQGQSLTWGSAMVKRPEPVRIEQIQLDKMSYNADETTHVTASLVPAQDAPERVTLRGELVDRLGRLVAVVETSVALVGPTPASLAIPVGTPLVPGAKVRLTVLDDTRVLSVAEVDTYTFPESFTKRHWDDWQSCIWGNPGGAYRREYLLPVYAKVYREYGVSSVLASSNWLNHREFEWPVREGFKIMPMNVSFGAINVGHRAPKGKMSFKEQKVEYQKTKDKQYLVRPVCLNSEEDLAPLAKRMRSVADYAGWLNPIGYNLGDEMSTTYYVTPYDYDFHPDSLAEFRTWLRGQHGSLQALNRGWETTFATWDDVLPMTAHEIKGRPNAAPWADHREFMDVTFARFFEWTRKQLRQSDPGAGVGMSGSQAAEAYGGYNWYRLSNTLDFVQNYTHQNTSVMQRSFAPGLHRAPWYGYSSRNPGARQTQWWRLFNGNLGGSYWSATFMFRPDLLPSPMTADVAPVIKEIQGGIATLLRQSERVVDVGIHYSQASIRGAFLAQSAISFSENRDGWVKALEDNGLQCEFLATAQLEAGELAKRNYGAFILPYSVCLSAKEAAAIRAYVAAGGLVIADAKTGLMDERCRILDKPRLQDLFGIARKAPDHKCASLPGDLRFTANAANGNRAGTALDVGVAEPSLTSQGGTVLAAMGDTSAMVSKQTGKGRTLFLNTFMDSYIRRRKLKIEKPITDLCRSLLPTRRNTPAVGKAVDDDAQARLFTVGFRNGRSHYVGAIARVVDKKAQEGTEIDVTFPTASHVYDVRKQAYVGHAKTARCTILPGDAALYALFPYRVTGIGLTVPKTAARGRDLPYELSVQTDGGAPDGHVLIVEVLGPDGAPRDHYGSQLVAPGGKATATIPLALNDPPGIWTMRATDRATGTVATATFTVN